MSNGRKQYAIELEEALAIALADSSNPELAKNLIKLCDSFPEVSLARLNEQGQTLLHLALESGAEKLVMKMLKRLQDNPILFHLDEVKRSLIWHAAAKGYTQFLKQMIEISKKQEAGSEGHKLWLIADVGYNSPLMMAVQNQHEEAAKLLLKEIANDDNAINIINQCNINGYTALHYACQNKSLLISLLFENKADFTVSNNIGTTPLDILRRLSFEKQIAIFNFLAKEFAFKAPVLRRLKAVLQPHLECHHHSSLRATDQVITARIDMINDYEEKGKEKVKDGEENIIDDQDTTKPTYLIVNDDRNTLTQLFNDITAYVNDLNNRSPNCYRNNIRSLYVITVMTMLALSLATLISLIVKFIESNSLDKDNVNSYFLAGALPLFTLGLSMIIPAFVAASRMHPQTRFLHDAVWHAEPTISKREYSKLYTRLQHEIQEKLNFLEAHAKPSPADSEIVAQLGTAIVALEQNHPRSQVVKIFEDLAGIICAMRMKLNSSQIPLTFFKPADSDENEEKVSFDDLPDGIEMDTYDEEACLLTTKRGL